MIKQLATFTGGKTLALAAVTSLLLATGAVA